MNLELPNSASDGADKSVLRRGLGRQRHTLSQEQVADLSDLICSRVLSLTEYRTACRIAGYQSVHHEVDPSGIIQHAHGADKMVFLPSVQSETMRLFFVRFCKGDPLQLGPFGIPEPAIRTEIIPCSQLMVIDLLLVPLLGFDRFGHRLGYGGGYYDRCMAAAIASCSPSGQRPLLVGLAYAMQEVAVVPCRDDELRLHYIVTEQEIITPRPWP